MQVDRLVLQNRHLRQPAKRYASCLIDFVTPNLSAKNEYIQKLTLKNQNYTPIKIIKQWLVKKEPGNFGFQESS